MIDYAELADELRAILADVPHPISNLANASAFLWENLPDLNWAGFYLMEDGKLILGPFQGKVACVEIEIGKGVCGTAVGENATQRVPDVHVFSGHIACDSASNSELVIPIRKNGEILGVLDMDSPLYDRFSPEDAAGLEKLVHVIEENI